MINTDNMSLKQAEHLLLELIDQSDNSHEMRKLYRFLRSIGIDATAHKLR